MAIGNVAKAAGYSVAIGDGANAYIDSDPSGSGLAVALVVALLYRDKVV